jgi:nucleotide-binding universal stress UspA family protein
MMAYQEAAAEENKPGRWKMFRKILVALDGSDHADKALDLTIVLAKALQGELILLHVLSDAPLTEAERRLAETEFANQASEALNPPPLIGDPLGPAESAAPLLQSSHIAAASIRGTIGGHILAKAEIEAQTKGVGAIRRRLESGDPAPTILSVADEEQPDLLAMGSRGLSDIDGLLLGSVSHKVAHLAKCTVMTVK